MTERIERALEEAKRRLDGRDDAGADAEALQSFYDRYAALKARVSDEGEVDTASGPSPAVSLEDELAKWMIDLEHKYRSPAKQNPIASAG